jgi:hypothetical protein
MTCSPRFTGFVVCLHHAHDDRRGPGGVSLGSGVLRKWPCAGGEVPWEHRQTDPSWKMARWPCIHRPDEPPRETCPAFLREEDFKP